MQVEARTQWCQNNDGDNDGLLMVRLEKRVPKVRGIANRGGGNLLQGKWRNQDGKCNELKTREGKRRGGQNNNPNLFAYLAVSLSPSVSTLTPLLELTLRISLPSSANSRFIICSSCPSGLSPSSTGAAAAKSGFLNIFLNASAMMAASAPLKGPLSPALPGRDVVDSASCVMLGASCCWLSCLDSVPPPPPPPLPGRVGGGRRAVAPRSGEVFATLAIMGDADPMEFRFASLSSFSLRRRIRRRMRNTSTHVATKARNPRTTMTAMAQWGNEEEAFEACWTAEVGDVPWE